MDKKKAPRGEEQSENNSRNDSAILKSMLIDCILILLMIIFICVDSKFAIIPATIAIVRGSNHYLNLILKKIL